MNRTKKEVLDWVFEDCFMDGGYYVECPPSDDYDVFLIAQMDHPKDGTSITTYGRMVEIPVEADYLVLNVKYIRTGFEFVKALLDRVFGSSDSWPDEYCDTLGWRLK